MKRTLKDYSLLILKGMGMGAADVVPGVSGGTIAFIVGIYEELINSIKSINGESLKLLFKGQCSGFNAEFLGAYDCDFYNRWIFDPSYDEHVYTETSWIPYNDSNYYPKYFLINANYNNLSASPKEDVFFVPLKLFRTSQYKYK